MHQGSPGLKLEEQKGPQSSGSPVPVEEGRNCLPMKPVQDRLPRTLVSLAPRGSLVTVGVGVALVSSQDTLRG